jgi:hypothetical protein
VSLFLMLGSAALALAWMRRSGSHSP